MNQTSQNRSFMCFHSPVLVVGILMAALACGCAETLNPVSTNISYGPDDQFANRVLSAADRREVLTIMKESVTGPADDPAVPARYGVRWTDVLLAARAACKDLECAVVSMTEAEDGAVKRIDIITLDDQPVVLTVERRPEPEIYRASARAGLFENRIELSGRLIERFDVAMRRYGAKPGWPPPRCRMVGAAVSPDN